ncbi:MULTISPECIES: WD40/YVTN/BNR-like repeat-containing protein [Clavibacter]|uniref:WD40/YVTN/BNR-like repeat-containing protein n=1 Tax=Clavibacter TaxID=1573 RepID=UPI003558DA06
MHGLDYDPATGRTYAAAHSGLWLIPTDTLAEYGTTTPATDTTEDGPLGGVAQDTMGFTVSAAAEGTLFASGHPDPAASETLEQPNLGLIRSIDYGATWERVSLRGDTDFHDLATASLPGGQTRIYGYDSGRGVIRISDDTGATWADGASIALRDLTVDASDPDRVFATTAEGLLVSTDAGRTFTTVPEAPALYLLDAVPNDAGGGLVGVATDGRIWTSTAELEWSEHGSTAGAAEAFSYVEGQTPWVLAFDDRGVVASSDLGQTWTVLRPR